MCQDNCNNRIFIPDTKIDIDDDLIIDALYPILVEKHKLGDVISYTISTDIASPTNGIDGKDGDNGLNGKDGTSSSITIGQVISGSNAQVTNTGTTNDVVLNFVLPKGDKGDNIKGDAGKDGLNGSKGDKGDPGNDGKDGLTKGISNYLFAGGGSFTSYSPMGNFTQGTYIDTTSSSLKKIRVSAWVSVANMQNWTTLKLLSSNIPSYNSGNTISQRTKHSEGQGYVGQYEIKAYIETTDRYIGFTFADNVGGTYSSDGCQYGDYGLEIFILV